MSQYNLTLLVALRKDILDPAGRAVAGSLNSLGFTTENVRIGKYITLSVEAENRSDAETKAHEMAKKLLVNEVMEDYTITISEN